MTIEIHDAKLHEDSGPFRSIDLFAEGENLEELLDTATYIYLDQDGGERGMEHADDKIAHQLITQKWLDAQK